MVHVLCEYGGRTCHKEYTFAIWKSYLLWFKSYCQDLNFCPRRYKHGRWHGSYDISSLNICRGLLENLFLYLRFALTPRTNGTVTYTAHLNLLEILHIRPPWILLGNRIHRHMGIRRKLQLQVSRKHQHMGSANIRAFWLGDGGNVHENEGQAANISADIDLHPVDVHVGVQHRVYTEAVRSVSLGLHPFPRRFHGAYYAWVRAPVVCGELHGGAFSYAVR